jgi:hypothetical protein
VKFQVQFFWIVTPHIAVVGRQHGPPKHWYPATTLHGITTQKTLSSFRFTLKQYISNTNFHIALYFSPKSVCVSVSSHPCYMFNPLYPPVFKNSNTISMGLIQFFPLYNKKFMKSVPYIFLTTSFTDTFHISVSITQS